MFSVALRQLPSFSVKFLTCLLAILVMTATVRAETLTLSISLGLSPKQAVQQYRPLIRYLEKATGRQIRLEANINPLAHWERMRRDDYDLVIDNPAFTAYRTARMNYTVIGKLPDVLSFTLVSSADEMMFDPSEMIGRPLATVASPAISSLRLKEIYPNPMQQPAYIEVNTHREAIEMVERGRAVGAMVPTALVGEYRQMNTVYTTDQLPAPGFSVSPKVSPAMRSAIREALLNAHKTAAGRSMLESLNVPRFEVADNAVYEGMDSLLEGMFGY